MHLTTCVKYALHSHCVCKVNRRPDIAPASASEKAKMMQRRRRVLALPPSESHMALEDLKEDGVSALPPSVRKTEPMVEKNLKNILEQLEEIQAAKGGAVAGAVSEIKKQLESIKTQVAAEAEDRDVKNDEYKHMSKPTP